jgi:hypothetical protein
VQTHAKRYFQITNQLLCQLSYAGVFFHGSDGPRFIPDWVSIRAGLVLIQEILAGNLGGFFFPSGSRAGQSLR